MAWKRWRDRSQVERVEVYTRQSLIWLMWFFPAVILLPQMREIPDNAWEAIRATLPPAMSLALGHAVMRDRFVDDASATGWGWKSIIWFGALPLWFSLSEGRPSTEYEMAAVASAWIVVVWGLSVVDDRKVLGFVAVVAVAFPWWATEEPIASLIGLAIAAFFVFTTRTSMWLYGVVRDLDVAQLAQTDLAVAEERLRFSRDVHDVLGRRLSSIAVQSELAATLAERGEPSAAASMRAVRATANESLREARELARGYRSTDLKQELDGARSLLEAAGIQLRVRLDGLPDSAHESAGWVVREALTNVLRHSDATQVTLAWRAPWLVIDNDRPNPGSENSDGTGLTGLAERLAANGGALETTRHHDHFTVRAHLPIEPAAPVEARTVP